MSTSIPISNHPCFELIAPDYDPKKNAKPLESYSSTSNEKVWWKCPCGHQYVATIESRLQGKGCPYDAGLRPIIGVSDLATVAPELVAEFDREKNALGPETFSPRSMRKVWWICKEGHSYVMAIARRMSGGVCPLCNPKQK